ncbi:hypothetical protein [Rhodanobacter lindaniclasticus]
MLSTATQPALASRAYFDARQNLRGLDNVREIIHDPDALYTALDRVEVELPRDWHKPTDWPQLAETLAAHESVRPSSMSARMPARCGTPCRLAPRTCRR